jgi:hypothetical protein
MGKNYINRKQDEIKLSFVTVLGRLKWQIQRFINQAEMNYYKETKENK